MQSRLNPYLGFDGNAREAMEFYKAVFGGKLVITTFEEGKMARDPADNNKVMHAVLEADNGIMFMDLMHLQVCQFQREVVLVFH